MSVSDKRHYDEYDIDCHGGLTYGAEPLPVDYGQKEKNYIGFDCGHYGDGNDFELALKYGLISKNKYVSYCNLAWKGCYYVMQVDDVDAECRKIVDQMEDKQ